MELRKMSWHIHRTEKVCANLKEVSLPPVKKIRVERRRIPVEKSGGGV
jgi:hypothetical protein